MFAKQFNRPVAAILLSAAIYGVFLLARLRAHDFEPSFFVVAGTDQYDAASSHPSLRSLRDGGGYDGQFYYRFAIDPFSRRKVDHGISLDAPAYRQQRILYPVLAWLASAGDPARVPAALIVVNYIGLLLIAWLGALSAIRVGRHALWGLAFSLYPGFIFTLSRDLTEIVAAVFLLAGLHCLHKSWHWAAAVCLTCAVLTRETTLLVAAALAITSVVDRRRAEGQRAYVWLYLMPVLIYAAWRIYLRSVWAGFRDVAIFGEALGPPFLGLADLWSRAFAAPDRLLLVWCLETCLLGAFVLCAIQVLHRQKDMRVEKIALIFYVAMAVSLGSRYWVEDQAFLRTTTEIYLLGLLALLMDRTRLPYLMSFSWIVAAIFTFRWRVEW
jgi:hypothetical protein